MIRVSQPVVGEREYEAVKAALDRGYYGHAEKVNEFEDRLREFLGAQHVVCVGNGTAALHLAVVALGLGPADEVVLPSLTFVSSFQSRQGDRRHAGRLRRGTPRRWRSTLRMLSGG